MPSAGSSRGTAQAPALGAASDSERVRLARVALSAALAVPGVVRGDAGPMHAHATPVLESEPLRGILCVATADGGYEVSFRLVAELVSLHLLAQRVGERVRAGAKVAGLAQLLRTVNVHFADLDEASP